MKMGKFNYTTMHCVLLITILILSTTASARRNHHHNSSPRHHTTSPRHHTSSPRHHHTSSPRHHYKSSPRHHHTLPPPVYTPPYPTYTPPPPTYTPPPPPDHTSFPPDMIMSSPPIQLHHIHSSLGNHVIMDNGIVNVTLSVPGGMVTDIQYNEINNLLEYLPKNRRGYWDIVWSDNTSLRGRQDMLVGTEFKVIEQNEDQVEVSFSRTWSFNDSGLPINTDKRYIMRRGSSGFYSYAIFDRPEGWPEVHIAQARIAFKLQQKLFSYMAVSDDRQKFMPSDYDRAKGRVLDYREAVLLTDPQNSALKGEVDDKYQFSCSNENNRVHGWISDSDSRVGFWVISPSDEFRSGGPVKQELTSHAGPTSLAMFFSGHYAGDVSVDLNDGEPWNKVFGPVFIYLNSESSTDNHRSTLWADAKQQMLIQKNSWPYDFPRSDNFLYADQRGTVTGRLQVQDWYQPLINASSAYVGLAPPGDYGSWQRDAKGYQFWNRTNDDGDFLISRVRPGNYNLFAWVPGVIGEYKYNFLVTITEGGVINLGNMVFSPLRNGPTLWEIGIPDRSAAEFFIPDPNPSFMTHLNLNDTNHSDKFRQYGLWQRYTELYPTEDLTYTVGTSNYRTDWFFAHVHRNVSGTFQPTTWQVKFYLPSLVRGSYYTLRLALASANGARLETYMNGRTRHHFRTGLIGRDNAIARHGIHGMYWLYEVIVPAYQLVIGSNTLFLRQFGPPGPFSGIMYDYIRLEGPPHL